MKIKMTYEFEIEESHFRNEDEFHDREFIPEALEEDLIPAIRETIKNVVEFNELTYNFKKLQ